MKMKQQNVPTSLLFWLMIAQIIFSFEMATSQVWLLIANLRNLAHQWCQRVILLHRGIVTFLMAPVVTLIIYMYSLPILINPFAFQCNGLKNKWSQ